MAQPKYFMLSYVHTVRHIESLSNCVITLLAPFILKKGYLA